MYERKGREGWLAGREAAMRVDYTDEHSTLYHVRFIKFLIIFLLVEQCS